MNMPRDTNVQILTIDSLPDSEVEVIGHVYAACCISRNVVRDLLANIRNFTVGGYLQNYSQLLRESTDRVYAEVASEARSLGADVVLSFRLTTTSVSQGAAELIGYGTAVRRKGEAIRRTRNLSRSCTA